MATLTVVSDLHLEARPLSLDEILDPSISSDVLCLLGDIGDPSSETYRDFLASCAVRFPTVLLLAGNNEYRNHDGSSRTMAQTEELIRQAAAAHLNVHFLQNDTYVLGNIAFIGTTLWSYLPDTPLPPPPSSEGEEKAADNGTTDHHRLAGGNDGAAAAAAADTPAAKMMVPGITPLDVLPPLHAVLPVIPAVSFTQDTDAAWDIGPIAAAASTTSVRADVKAQGAVCKGGDEAASMWRHRLVTGSEQPQGRQGQESQRQQEVPLVAAGGVVIPQAQRNSLSQVRQWGLSFLPSTLYRAGRGCGSATGLQPPPPPAAAGRAGAAASAPRFMSYSQPPADWLKTLDLKVSCSPGYCSGGCGIPGGVGRVCRRRRLRHCVSLSSLLPDEPCPSWRGATRPGRRSSSSSADSSSSSSESDARSTDSDSSQSSDIDRSDSSPYATADSCRELTLPSGAEKTVARPAAAAAAAAGSGAPSEAGMNVTVAPLLSSSSDNANPACFFSKGSLGDSASAFIDTDLRTNRESDLLQVTPPPAVVAAAAATTTAIPVFQSDPGYLDASGVPAASAAEEVRKPFTPATDASAATAPSPFGRDDASAAAGVDTAPSLLKPPRNIHHHHQHHHRHSSSSASSHKPPPATIREFIGETSLDYRRIFASPGGPPITPEVTNSLFVSSLEYLRGAVKAASERGLLPVVLSHHAPSMRGTSRPAFAGHPSTHAYSTDLDAYLADSGIAAWYCGHTHYNFDLLLPGGVRLASNQFGSQPKPADGYSRNWQHRLPTASRDGR